jgi:hypothetical protein
MSEEARDNLSNEPLPATLFSTYLSAALGQNDQDSSSSKGD